jgi:SAM-dependent methyltransferase
MSATGRRKEAISRHRHRESFRKTHDERKRNDTKERQSSMTVELNAIKEKQQKTWASGDYAVIGNSLVIMGERLVEAVDLRSGDKVLDVATGTGNTAISAARRYADATGVDYVPSLIEQAKERAEAEGLEIAFDVGDVEDLPYADASFDAVLSSLGVMFAPDQEKTASELLRVTKSRGRIGLANWTPDGFIGAMFRTIGGHVSPPPGIKPPPLWGTEERLTELLGEEVSSLEATRRSYVFRYLSPGHFVETFRSYYGPVHKAFESLDAAGQDALARDLEELVHAWNTSGNEAAVVPSDYLEVVAVRQ